MFKIYQAGDSLTHLFTRITLHYHTRPTIFHPNSILTSQICLRATELSYGTRQH